MEIAILLLLFVIGTVASAYRAMKYLDFRQQRRKANADRGRPRNTGHD